MGTATFLANDDIAACVDVLHVPSPCFTTYSRRVPLFTVGIVLREGCRTSRQQVHVSTLTLRPCPTDVFRSLRPNSTSNC